MTVRLTAQATGAPPRIVAALARAAHEQDVARARALWRLLDADGRFAAAVHLGTLVGAAVHLHGGDPDRWLVDLTRSFTRPSQTPPTKETTR